jgi:hypothetical protein
LSGAFFDVVTSGLSSPEGISFGSDGSLYIANQGTNEVLRYNGTGLSVFVTAGSGGLNQPRQGVFGPDGNLYVASQGTAQVLRYDGLTGAFIDTFASTNLGQGQTQGPIWLEFGTDGHLYTTARTNPVGGDTSIIRFNATTGAFADTLPIGRDSWSFIVGPGNVVYYSGNGGANYIERYGPSSLAAFTVSLDSPSVAPVTVQFTTADETALLGSDYVAATGTITFAPGETTRTVLVRTLDDALSEPAESFVVNLSNPVGATIADGQAVGTIADNEPLRVASAVVNGGAAQRSRVTDLTINFTGVATLPANPADAFRLTRTGPGTLTGDVTLSVDLSASTTTQTVARLTFGGSLTESGSLMDGTYTLTVLGGQVSGPGGGPLDGDGNGTPGGDSITTLHRLYGDVTGDRFVNGADFALFRTAFGTALGDAGYTPDLDLNGDGFVNGADFAAFRTRFGGGL